jgi:hypothetical protein
MVSAIERFRREFRRWVRAHDEAKGYVTNPERLLRTLNERIGVRCLTRIGSAYLNGWLQTEIEPGRGYFVRETDRPGLRGGQFAITHQGQDHVAPCWELFVQLADYSWLRTVAQRHGQVVRLEDRRMDLSVRAAGRLVLYVEHKTTRRTAESLVERMRQYGHAGFNLTDPDRGNDPLRKAKYLVREESQPMYFGLSAVDYRHLFKVEYLDGNRFRLIEDARPFSAILAEHTVSEADGNPSWAPVDPLAIEMEWLCPEVWISVGSAETAYNFYCPTERGDSIVLGVYQNGHLWTDLAALGPERAMILATGLAGQGIELDLTRKWTFWRAGRTKLNLRDADPVMIAEAVRRVLDLEPGCADRPPLQRQVQC